MKDKISPQKCRTIDDVCSITTDNYSTDNYWIAQDPKTISIYRQRAGFPSEQEITIPKKDFDKLIKWYLREQKIIRRPE